MRRAHTMPFGATVTAEGVRFGLWAPAAHTVDVGIGEPLHGAQWHPMQAQADGWFALDSPHAAHGSRYRFRIDGRTLVPDPASRYNPGDVHGASEVVDPNRFAWNDQAWRGRPWHEAVIYELHVGAFTQGGTFGDVQSRLDYLAGLGVTALELMPLADFPGRCNWGYDGALLFAPDATYGHPDALKALVAAAHRRGLMVLLDVVYNHFGPEGNYLHVYAPQFFTRRYQTPWGAAIDFEGEHRANVRAFFVHNALYWLEEFNFDGLRLDAVHAITDHSTPDILSEIAAAVHAGPGRDRPIHLVLENDRNEAWRLARDSHGRPRQYTAQWNDDLHHVLHHMLTAEGDGYYGDYVETPMRHLGRCLAEGFAYQGEASSWRDDRPRGERSTTLPPMAFVGFLQNHDQVGNRAFGERLHTLASPAALQAALAILLLAPSPPLLFMGEEFAAATPFLFFCDFEPALAEGIVRGRREEFKRFARFRDPALVQRIPDPTAETTFVASKLDWTSLTAPTQSRWLAYYGELLAVRQREVVPLIPDIGIAGRTWRVEGANGLVVQWPLADQRALALYANLGNREMLLPPERPNRRMFFRTPNILHDKRVFPPWSAAFAIVAD